MTVTIVVDGDDYVAFMDNKCSNLNNKWL